MLLTRLVRDLCDDADDVLVAPDDVMADVDSILCVCVCVCPKIPMRSIDIVCCPPMQSKAKQTK